MKKFILKTTIGFFTTVICLSLLRLVASPFWGNEILLDKLNYLDYTSTSKFDTYFIGSSRVNHQIDAKLYDEITKHKSFNLGCPALSGIESIRLAEYLISQGDEQNQTTHIFIEMPLLDFHKSQNTKTTRGSYYFNLNALYHSTASLVSEQIRFRSKLCNFSFQSKTAISNLLNLGTFRDLMTRLNRKVPESKKVRFDRTKGYIALAKGQESVGDLKRRNDFLQDTSELTLRLNDAKTYIARRKNLLPINSKLQTIILKLIADGKEAGINVVVLYFPKSNGIIYKKSAKIFNALPTENKINLAKPSKYRDLYLAKYSYDKAHLNKAGSTVLTRALAAEFLNIKRSER